MDWNNINRDRDTSGLWPIEYDQSKVPNLIRKHADNVRTKTYGQEVREAQARNAELAGLIASEAVDISNETKGRQDTVESQFNAVQQEMTDKDVISAPEIIAARGGLPQLEDRLDATDAQLAQNAKKTEKTISIHQYEYMVQNGDWTDAFRKAMNDYPTVSSLIILLNDITYKVTKALYFTRRIELKGVGIGKTIVDFTGITEKVNAPYNSAIIFAHEGNLVGGAHNSENPIILPVGQVGKYGLNARMKDLTIKGSLTDVDVNGVFINCPVQLERVRVDTFSGHGVVLGASGVLDGLKFEGNANHTQLDYLYAYGNGKDGILIVGNDANTFVLNQPVVIGNKSWGIYDNSLLGGTVIGAEADTNLTGAYGGQQDTSRTVWLSCYAEQGTQTRYYNVPSRNVILGALGAQPESGQPYIGSVVDKGAVSYRPFIIADTDQLAYDVGGTTGSASRLSKDKLDIRSKTGTDLITLGMDPLTGTYGALLYGSSRLMLFPYNDVSNAIKRGRPHFPNGISFDTNTSIEKGTAPPTSGSYARGQIILNTSPVAGSFIGWVCTTTGTPGTWKGFGAIEA